MPLSLGLFLRRLLLAKLLLVQDLLYRAVIETLAQFFSAVDTFIPEVNVCYS
jgi:hypothetical protein